MLARAGLFSAITLALTVAPLAAQQANPAPKPATVHLEVSGNSTIRGWTCQVDGTVAAVPASGGTAVAGYAGGVQTVTVTVPVRAFTCPEDEMTEHLLDALKPNQHREITYKLERYTLNGNRARAAGQITMGGVTKPLTVSGTITPAGQGFRFVGEAPLNMTEFGIEPPVVMMGVLKVRPQVRVKFDAVVPAAS